MRRPERKLRAGARARPTAGELVVGTFSVRTLTLNDTNGTGHSEVIFKVCQELESYTIGLPASRDQM